MDKEDEKAYHQDIQEMDREPTDEELDIMFLRILEEERLTADRRVTWVGNLWYIGLRNPNRFPIWTLPIKLCL